MSSAPPSSFSPKCSARSPSRSCLGLPSRYYVITTAIYQLIQQYPPKIQIAAAMGVSLFAVMFVMLFLYRRDRDGRQLRDHHRESVPAAGGSMSVRCATCCSASACSFICLPRWPAAGHAAVTHRCRRSPSLFPAAENLTLDNFRVAMTMNAVRSALSNSLLLGFGTATIGVMLMGLLAWLIYRSRLPASGLIEYVVMFPQAVPRLVFAFGLMWAWVVFPDSDLWNAVAAADRLPHGVSAARRAHHRRRHAAD